MSSAIDPWEEHEAIFGEPLPPLPESAYPPGATPLPEPMTPGEYEAIRDAIWSEPWNDAARFPDLLTRAVSALGEIALEHTYPDGSTVATHVLRRMMQRVLIGEWQYETEDHS